jgi:hypothetical protein
MCQLHAERSNDNHLHTSYAYTVLPSGVEVVPHCSNPCWIACKHPLTVPPTHSSTPKVGTVWTGCLNRGLVNYAPHTRIQCFHLGL